MLLLGAASVVLGLAGLAALRLPAVQLRILRWAAEAGEGWRLNVARVSVGLGGGEVRGLDFSMPGIVASTEPGVVVRVRPGRFLFGGRELHVERAEAEGVRIVVTPSEMETDTGAGAGEEPFAGVLAELSSPLPWVLGVARIGAEIVVRDDGAEVATARVRIEGGGVSAASVGEFEYDWEAASRLLPPGPEAVVRSRGTVRVKQNASHGVAEVELRGDLRLPAYGAVRLPAADYTLTIAETVNGERYAGTLRFGAEDAAARVELDFSAELDRDKQTIAGTVKVAADTRALAWAGVPPDGIPAARVVGAGTFSYGVDDGAIASRFAAGTEEEREYFTVATEDGESARVELRGLPLAWLAERAAAFGVGVGEARASGVWTVRHAGGGKVFLDTKKGLEIGPVTYEDGLVPALPAALLRADVAAELTPERVRWELRSLRAGTVEAGGPEARVTARGEWSLDEAGGGLVEAANVELRASESDAEPVLKTETAGAIRVDATGAPRWEAGREVAKVAVRELPLAWATRWLDGKALDGVWAEGVATIRTAEEAGGFLMEAERPWRFANLRVADETGAVLFAGEASLRPAMGLAGDGRLTGAIEELSVKDANGRALAGKLSGWWAEAEEGYGAEVELRAELPAGDVAPKEFGALAVELRAKAGSVAKRVGQVERFSLVASNADGELAALRGEGGWLYAQRPTGEVLVNSLEAWTLTTAPVRLERLAVFFPEGVEAEGEIAETEFLVMAEMGVWKMRPKKPLAVRGLTATRGGVDVARAVDVALYPGLDLRTPHVLKPALQLAWEASLHATEGRVNTPGGRALEFEAALGMMGDLENALPQTVDVVARGDVAAARAGFPEATAGWPAAGRFTARIDGDMLGKAPLEAWARIEAVPAAEGGRLLAPLEMVASGQVNGNERTASFDVAVRMGDGEAAGDLAFGVKLALEDATLRLDSALRGKRWDVTESLAWARAMGGAAVVEEAVIAEEPAPRAGTVAATPLGSAFWGPLRGSFELDIGELWMTPYRVEGLRGRVAVEERALVVD
ncbi:MAG: hypothetical protein MUE42_07785, partial [Opitutaceae bacterium]|nr:hypothetical protein [Opitutaceae bacterium]